MTNDPDQMRANIEATRGDLSRNVDALTESVRPGNVARRQKDKVNSAVSGAKDAVMGHAGSVQSTGSDALQATGDAISSAPNKVQQSAQGNPLAAGLIAVGVGWVAVAGQPAGAAGRSHAEGQGRTVGPAGFQRRQGHRAEPSAASQGGTRAGQVRHLRRRGHRPRRGQLDSLRRR